MPESDEVKGLTCSVCYDAPTQPVVTRCGHLMCWECLRRWEQHERTTGVIDGPQVPCPVCRGGVDPYSSTDVHPILGAGERDPRGGASAAPGGATPPPASAAPPPPPPRAERAPEPRNPNRAGFNPFGGAGVHRAGGGLRGLGMGMPFFFFFGGGNWLSLETAVMFLLPLAVIILSNTLVGVDNNAAGFRGRVRRFIGQLPDGSVAIVTTAVLFLLFAYVLTSTDLTDIGGMEPSRNAKPQQRAARSKYARDEAPRAAAGRGATGGSTRRKANNFGPQVTIV